MIRVQSPALLLAAWAAALPAAAAEPWDRNWVEVATEHFVIESALSERRTLELAADLEGFRLCAQVVTNIGRYEERIPTRIYILEDAQEEAGIRSNIAGYFRPGMRENLAVMIPSGDESDEVLKHEYTHFLVRNRDSRLYPLWYEEGFADFLSTCTVRDGFVEWGRVRPWQGSWLTRATWTSYEKILGVRDSRELGSERRSMFYAQSWLLTHYLMIGWKGDFTEAMARFLRLAEAGRPPLPAFEEAFGIPPDQLATILQRYIKKIRFNQAKLRRPMAPPPITTRRMAKDEIASELGRLVLAASGPEEARRFFEAALAQNPQSGDAVAGLGDARRLSGHPEEAKPLHEKAIELHPEEANYELDLAEDYLDLATAATDPGQVHDDLVEARRHFARSFHLEPRNPETLAMNGRTYLFSGQDLQKGLESLEAAHQLLPSHTGIRQLLAQAYIASGQREQARAQILRLLAWSPPSQIEGLKQLLRRTEAPEKEPPASQGEGQGGEEPGRDPGEG